MFILAGSSMSLSWKPPLYCSWIPALYLVSWVFKYPTGMNCRIWPVHLQIPLFSPCFYHCNDYVRLCHHWKDRLSPINASLPTTATILLTVENVIDGCWFLISASCMCTSLLDSWVYNCPTHTFSWCSKVNLQCQVDNLIEASTKPHILIFMVSSLSCELPFL